MNITVFNQLVLTNYGFYDQKQTFENYNYNIVYNSYGFCNPLTLVNNNKVPSTVRVGTQKITHATCCR